MKIQNFKRIVKENFSEKDRPLASTIGFSINSFAEEVINALNNNLTISDNLNMQIKELELSVDSDGIPVNKTQFKSTLKSKCQGMHVIKLENLTNTSSYPSGAPFLSFSEDNKVITINHITGLSVNNKYNLTLLSIG